MASSKLPVDFIDQMNCILGSELDDFIAALEGQSTVSIRLHPHKNVPSQELQNKVPWTEHGYYLEERPSFTYDPIFHAGGYYVQDASSMFLEYVLKCVIPEPQEDTSILDLCAAPGGKSTILLSHLNKKGLLVANEVIHNRSKILEDNLIKWGFSNYMVTQSDSSYFVKEKCNFDLVLVDAPCSGEGLFRKDQKAIQEWSLKHVRHCALRQQRILDNAVKLIKPGGYLIYSSCTYNDIENENQIERVLNQGDWSSISIPIQDNWGVEASNNNIFGYRFYPHRLSGEGFYISILKRNGNQNTVAKKSKKSTKSQVKVLTSEAFEKIKDYVIDKDVSNYILLKDEIYHSPTFKVFPTLNKLRSKTLGCKVGRFAKEIFIPNHALVQSLNYSKFAPHVDLSIDQAIQYLKGNTPALQGLQSGWNAAFYKKLPLGWIKGIQNRYNNYYPKYLRIKK